MPPAGWQAGISCHPPRPKHASKPKKEWDEPPPHGQEPPILPAIHRAASTARRRGNASHWLHLRTSGDGTSPKLLHRTVPTFHGKRPSVCHTHRPPDARCRSRLSSPKTGDRHPARQCLPTTRPSTMPPSVSPGSPPADGSRSPMNGNHNTIKNRHPPDGNGKTNIPHLPSQKRTIPDANALHEPKNYNPSLASNIFRTKLFTFSMCMPAVSEKRNRAVPSGTVGGRTGRT